MQKAIKAVGKNGKEHIIFHCPGCNDNHQIIVGVWGWNGLLDEPTFEGSVLVQGGEDNITCHSFVKDGSIQYLSDSTHVLSGQTVPLPTLDNWTNHVSYGS